jgi:hypothetical protein
VTLLRASLVAVLLLTAAGVIYRTGSPEPERHAEPPPVASPLPTVPPTPLPPDSRLPIPEGRVGVPVALGTPAALAMVRPGDRVDLLLVVDDRAPVVIAPDVPVLAVAPLDGALFLALSPPQAREVVATTARFAVIVQP